MDLLGKIFNNASRVKIMRLFLWAEGVPLDMEHISKSSQVKSQVLRRELSQLASIGFIEKKKFVAKVLSIPRATKKAKKTKTEKQEFKKVEKTGWVLNTKFELVEPLRNLLIETELVRGNEIVQKIRNAGKIELLVLSGVFVRDENRKVDVLVVGKNLDAKILEKQIAIIESEVGKELSYSYFTVEEFNYRLGMYDKLLRDVFENQHTTLVNTILR